MTRDIINPTIEPPHGPHYLFGERVRSARLALGLTLRSAANTCGLSMTQLSQIERGDIMPSVLDVWPLMELAVGMVESYKKGART